MELLKERLMAKRLTNCPSSCQDEFTEYLQGSSQSYRERTPKETGFNLIFN